MPPQGVGVDEPADPYTVGPVDVEGVAGGPAPDGGALLVAEAENAAGVGEAEVYVLGSEGEDEQVGGGRAAPEVAHYGPVSGPVGVVAEE